MSVEAQDAVHLRHVQRAVAERHAVRRIEVLSENDDLFRAPAVARLGQRVDF